MNVTITRVKMVQPAKTLLVIITVHAKLAITERTAKVSLFVAKRFQIFGLWSNFRSKL